MSTFGSRLKFLRKNQKLTQDDLSKTLSVNRATLANWEIDRTMPDSVTIAKLAHYFDVTIDYLMGNADHPQGVLAWGTGQEKKGIVEVVPDKKKQQPKDLKKFLDESEVMFDGELYNLDEEDKQKVRDALEFAFWHAKQKNKRKKT